MTLTWLTPAAGVVAVAALAPLAAVLAGRKRAARVRNALGLAGRSPDVFSIALVTSLPLVLALAATQPALIHRSHQPERTDAAVFFVVDVSRSMLAAARPGAPTRLQRARTDAARIRSGLQGVPAGIASLTDRVEPLLFPTPDQATFDSTLKEALRVESPPPLEIAPNATSFNALASLGTQGFFAKAARRRVVVVLTDGESQSLDVAQLSASLAGTPFVVLQIWNARERVYDNGVAEPAYRPDPDATALAGDLARATGGRAFDAGQVGAATDAVRRLLGSGPTRAAGVVTRITPLAPWIALAAVVPLALLLRRRLLLAF